MVILSKFAENLSALMQEHNLNAPALGEKLDTHRTNITRYLQGIRLPNYELFIKIVEYFNVSADVLLGRFDYCDVQEFQPVLPFGTTFRKALDLRTEYNAGRFAFYKRTKKQNMLLGEKQKPFSGPSGIRERFWSYFLSIASAML